MPSTQSTTKKKEGGDSDIHKSSIPVHTCIHKVFKKNRLSQPIMSNDSTISSRLQMKLRPTSPFHHNSTQTLAFLLVKVMFLPQIDLHLIQIGAKLKENVLGRRGNVQEGEVRM